MDLKEFIKKTREKRHNDLCGFISVGFAYDVGYNRAISGVKELLELCGNDVKKLSELLDELDDYSFKSMCNKIDD